MLSELTLALIPRTLKEIERGLPKGVSYKVERLVDGLFKCPCGCTEVGAVLEIYPSIFSETRRTRCEEYKVLATRPAYRFLGVVNAGN